MAFFSWKIVGCVLVALHLSAYGENEERQMFYATCDGVPPEGETLFGGKANCTAEEAEDWPGELFVPVTETNPMYQVLSQACLYGYILFIAANEIGDGADLLLLSPKFGPLVGSILVPILGAVPDGLMVLFSGLNKETAPKQIKVGVGALAGSTVMLLTLPWFLSIITGRVKIEGHGKDRYATIKRPADADDDWDKMGTPGSFSLFHQGIQLHPAIQENAKLMIKLSFPYYLIQIPAYISEQKYPGDDADSKAAQVEFEKPFVWIGMILSGLGFLYYLYLMWKDSQSDKSDVKQQVIQMNVEMIEKGHLTLRGAMHDFRVEANVAPGKGGLEEGLVGGLKQPSEEAACHMCHVLVPFFRKYDLNGDNQISIEEFRLIMNDLGESNIAPEKQQCIFKAADMDSSGFICFEEFVACIMAFAIGMPEKPVEFSASKTAKPASTYVTAEKDAGADDDDDEDAEEDMPEDLADLSPEEQQSRIKKRACSKLLVGSLLVLLFSDPMCSLLDVIGSKIGVDPFYIGFLIAPLASNASELMSSMTQAKKKTMSGWKNALSTLEGAACMNNTFCLFFFFFLIILQELRWAFCAETISIVLVELIMGLLALFCPIHTCFTGFFIFLLYPGSLLLVHVMEDYLGFD